MKSILNFLVTRYVKLKNSFFVVVLLIQFLLILIALVFYHNTVLLIQNAQNNRISDVIHYVDNQLSLGANSAKTAVLTLSRNEAIAKLVAEQDRKQLDQEVQPMWKDLQPLGIGVLEFYLQPKDTNIWINFYRAHNPSQYGDTIEKRPLIVTATQTQTAVYGLEQGHSGYSFRATAPINYQGKFVGVADVGFDLGNAFLSILEKAYPGNWGILNLIRGMKSLNDRVLINAIGPDKEKYFQDLLPNDMIMKNIHEDKPYYEMDEKTSTISLYIPVKNFQGDIALIFEYVSPTDYYKNLAHARNEAILICLIGLLSSGLIIYILFKLITTPIKELVLETTKIKNFDLDESIKINSSLSEVRELIDAMGAMKVGLQSFRKYTPDLLVRQLLANKQTAEISGQRRNLTILFSDISDFTTISEQLTPNELASQLSEYFDEMSSIIINHGGTIDKYIGDAIMAFWGAPLAMKDHANQACLAALACEKKIKDLAVKWKIENKPIFNVRVGINTGEVIVGNLGSSYRLSYTVMGDAVNLAERLQDLNKSYNTSILIGQATLNELPDDYAYRLVDIVVVKGKTEPLPIYELVALKGDITSLDAEFLHLFSDAVHYYVKKDWARAKMRFVKLLHFKPKDHACEIFIQRCDEYEKNPPPEDWAGEYYFHKSK